MKKSIFIAMFAILALVTNAQSDYSSYLNKALEKLEAGDCESAQKNYDLYKELSGEVKNSVQVMIDDCQKTKTKTYTLGEEIEHNGFHFRVAYLYGSSGEHGLAVRSGTSTKIVYSSTHYCYGGHLITLSELKTIIPNKNYINLSGTYWTSTVAKATKKWYSTKYWVKNIETGIEQQFAADSDSPFIGSMKLLYVINF